MEVVFPFKCEKCAMVAKGQSDLLSYFHSFSQWKTEDKVVNAYWHKKCNDCDVNLPKLIKCDGEECQNRARTQDELILKFGGKNGKKCVECRRMERLEEEQRAKRDNENKLVA